MNPKIISVLKNSKESWHSFSSSRFFWPMILLLGILLRGLFYVECVQTDLLALNQLRAMDMEKFLNWARILVVEGRWLSDFSTADQNTPAAIAYHCFYQSPLYPYFMAFVYWITGQDPAFGFNQFGYRCIVIAQQLLGLMALWPLHEISRRLMGRSAARFLVFLFLFCDIILFFETILLRAFLIAFVYLYLVHNLLVLRESRTLKRALVTGIWLGLAWVTKANFVALVPFLLFWILWQRPQETPRKRWNLCFVFVLLGLVSVLVFPVGRNLVLRQKAKQELVAQNQWEGKNPVPIFKMTTRGPYSYINGNSYHAADRVTGPNADITNPGSTQGLGWDFNSLKQEHYKTLFFAKDSAFSRRTLEKYPGDNSWQQELGTLPVIMKLVWAEHNLHKSWWTRFWPMIGYKVLAFVNGFEMPNNTNIFLHRQYSKTINFFFVNSTLICFAFLVSLFLLLPEWKKPEVSLLLGFVLIYMSLTVAFYFIARFRVPVLPLMAIVGMAGLSRIPTIWQRRGVVVKSLIGVGLLAALMLAWPRDVRGGVYQEAFETLKGIRYADYYNYALGKQVLQDPQGALEITRDGVVQRGAFIFYPLLRIHFWALHRLPEHREEMLVFCQKFKKFCQGQGEDPRYARQGPYIVQQSLRHAALYSLALDQLLIKAAENKNREKTKENFEILQQLYKYYGEQRLVQSRYDIILDASKAQALSLSQAFWGSQKQQK